MRLPSAVPLAVVASACFLSACGPRYLIVPDRLTSAKKVAVVEYIVDGPVDFNPGTSKQPGSVIPVRHSLSVAATALEMVEGTNTALADDGRVEVIPTQALLTAAGYQLLKETPPARTVPGYNGSVPVVSATGFKGNGDDLPTEMQKAISECGADLGVIVRQDVRWLPGPFNIGGKLSSNVLARIVTSDGALVYEERFHEESKVTVNAVAGIADERTLKEALLELGQRTGNRLRSVIRTGAPVSP